MSLSSMGEKMWKNCPTVFCRCATWILCVSAVYYAHAIQTPAIASQSSHVSKLSISKAPGVISPLEATAEPATVILKNGHLTVEANNSDLGQILASIANASGMTIEGTVTSARVFGVYGPQSPHDVLTDLLTGAGYNFMMVGVTNDGVPRQLLITPRKDDSPPAATPRPASPSSGDRENPDADTSEPDQLGPGAIEHVPPAQSPDPQERVKQNLQRLEQMRQQKDQQKPPQ